MPLVQGRKRRAQAQEDDDEPSLEPSPEPQTQRRRTQAAIEDEDAYAGYGGNDDSTQSTGEAQMVKKLVRLALACEYQRRPMRRADISEHVLGASASRQFRSVFSAAQLQLRSVFGMEMVELPAREKVTLQQKRKAASQAPNKSGTGAWILTNILPGEFRDPDILPPSKAPTSGDEARYTAIYTVLISLISLSGGQLPDAKMERYLTRLNMQDNTPVPGFEKTEKLLKRLERDLYVIKVRESAGAGGEEDISWAVGPRGKVEVGNDGVRGLAKVVYGGGGDDAEEEELDRKLHRSLGIGEVAARDRTDGETQSQQRKKGRPRRQVREEDEDEDDDDEDESD